MPLEMVSDSRPPTLGKCHSRAQVCTPAAINRQVLLDSAGFGCRLADSLTGCYYWLVLLVDIIGWYSWFLLLADIIG